MLNRVFLVITGLLTVLPQASFAASKDEAKDRVKVLIVPGVALGAVQRLSEKRVSKAFSDAVAAASRFELVTDRDKAVKSSGPADKVKAVQAKGSATSRRIDEADLLRQEGTDLAAEGKHSEALGKLRTAIAAYEKSYTELVDFTKLADAYARAGLSAFATNQGRGEVGNLFESGIAIQPTLVIDRRKQAKELLELFDGTHERMEKATKAAVTVDGTAPGAIAFVDGVKVGELPATAKDLLPGTHYVQVRGDAWQPWGQVVKIKGKDLSIHAKALPVKVVAPPPAEVELKVDVLADCAQHGAFAAESCRKPAQHLAKQTGADFLVFSAIKADRYNRLTIHGFVLDAQTGFTVATAPAELAADLSDLQAKASKVAEDLDAATHPFAKARALAKPPAVFKDGAK